MIVLADFVIPDPITTGGTVGLILALCIAVIAFARGTVRPGVQVEEADKRTERALRAGERATAAVESLTAELRRQHDITEKVMAELEKRSKAA